MMTRLYHLTTINLAIGAVRNDMLESMYDRGARDMARKGLESARIKSLLDDQFRHDNYLGSKGTPSSEWFEDCHLIFSCSPTPQICNRYINDEIARNHLVRFTVDVEGSLQLFDDDPRNPGILCPNLGDQEDDQQVDRNYIGVMALNLDDVVAIAASPLSQGRLRAAITRHGSEHIRSVPIDIIHYKNGTLFEIKF